MTATGENKSWTTVEEYVCLQALLRILLSGIPILLFEEKSAGEYLKSLWGIENENFHSARGICVEESRTRIFDLQGIKNSNKFMLRVKKVLATSLENQG